MHRLFVAPARLAASTVTVEGDDLHYLGRVLRAAVGDRVLLFDGAGVEADAEIVQIGPEAMQLRVGTRRREPRAHAELTLILGLLKGEKMDWVVQKATELGVCRIVPVATERTVMVLAGERAAARVQRWDKIAREAARQSGAARVPEVAPVSPLAAALAAAGGLRLLFSETARDRPLALPAAAAQVTLAIGPEGGFSEAEVAAAQGAGFRAVGLGPRVLRAETAALAALAVVGYLLGDLA